MSVNDDLGNRMKDYYENIPKIKLYRRTPVIIRIDGKSFHSFTRGFKKPFDDILIKSMQETMKYLCENIQGCVLGYQQSDEISLLLIDYKTLNSGAFFDYEVQKICSVIASMATLSFNKAFNKEIGNIPTEEWLRMNIEYRESLIKSQIKGAMFDARCFNIPKEEVANYFFWRQIDATRNSIEMVGRSKFSHKELQHKNCNMIQDMLHEEYGINWNDLPTYLKRGSCCIKVDEERNGMIRSKWIIDKDIPKFIDDERDYIEKLVI